MCQKLVLQGLNRPLKQERDFIRAIGKKIRVRTLAPLQGRRNFTGDLKNFQDGILHLEMGGKMVALSWTEVGKANLVYEFKH